METKFKNFKHFNKFKYPYKNYKYQVNKSKDNVRETVKDTAMVKVSDKLTDPSKTGFDNLIWQEDFQKLKTNLISMIELKTKYYIDQRMGILINGNSLYTRGYCSLNILDDFSHGGKSLVYKNNGNPVVTMTQDGYIYCKNIFLNGLNVYEMFQRIFNDFSEGGSIYVKHIDLKNGLYDMDINSSIMKYLKVQPDVNNYLEVFKDNDDAMVMETSGNVAYTAFKSSMTSGDTFYGLRFGKDSSYCGLIRYTYNSSVNDSFMGLGPTGVADTLKVYNDRRVIIRTDMNLEQSLLCKYDGNLSNSKYLRIGCGDNRDTGIFAYGRESNTNYLYLKLQGRSAELKIYNNYTLFKDHNHFAVNCTKNNGGIGYLRMSNVGSSRLASLYIGKAESLNQEIGIGYKHSTSNPLGYLGFYGNEELITWDKNGNLNINALTASGMVSCNGFYSSDYGTFDGTLACTQLDVANTLKNTWYAKLRVEDYLSNGEYIRMILKDLGGKANIDLFHDSQYYGLKLKIDTPDNTNDNKLCIYPTGVTIDGDLDCYNNATVWENLEVAKDISISNTTYGLKTNNISAYSGSTVTVNSNIYIDNTNQLQTDILNSAFDNHIQCLSNMEITNEDNDAVLASDNIVVYDKLQVDAVDINSVATSSDVNDNSKINDNTIATTAYINNLNNTTIHQEVPNNPYESVATTYNPYLKWSITSIGSYNTNTDAICFSEELHQFVIIGNNGHTYFSYDGFTWLNSSMNSFTWTGVTYGPTYGYVACTSSNMYLIVSTDGKTWVPKNNVSPGTGCAITYGNNYYAIVPDGSNASYLSYTTNPTIATGWGSYWLGSSGKWYNIAYSKKQKKFLVVGATGKYVSFDDEFSSGSRNTGQITEVTKDCQGVCYSEKLDLWVIACNDSTYCYVSQDGITFTQQTLPYQTSWHRVIWGNDRFIMTTNGSTSAAYSLDGTNWYPFDISTIGAYSSWLGLAYGNGLFVLSGNNNTAPLNSLVATYTLPNSYITPRAIMQQIYPIGSIYISMVNINPGVIFGGSWTEIQNKFLYAVPTTSNSGNTGGTSYHAHVYGIRYAGWWGSMRGLNSGDSIQLYDNGIWKPSIGEGVNTNISNNNYGGNTGNAAVQFCTANTGSTSTMPPYVTVYAWYRIA